MARGRRPRQQIAFKDNPVKSRRVLLHLFSGSRQSNAPHASYLSPGGTMLEGCVIVIQMHPLFFAFIRFFYEAPLILLQLRVLFVLLSERKTFHATFYRFMICNSTTVSFCANFVFVVPRERGSRKGFKQYLFVYVIFLA
jgi:hypothetical protein